MIAAPGIAHFTHRPTGRATTRVHTCDLVDFDDYAGANVLIVGGRQSAYEWAALLGEHGAARIDVVHRHPQPRFERVSWRFVDPLIDETLAARRLVAHARRRPSATRSPAASGRSAG